jgi:hypothetical protein
MANKTAKTDLPVLDPVTEVVKPDQANLRAWFDELQPPRANNSHSMFEAWVEQGLMYRAVKTGQKYFSGSASGMVGENAADVLKNIDRYQLGRRIFEQVSAKGDSSKIAWAWDNGGVVVNYWGDGEIRAWVMSSDEEVVRKLVDLIRRAIKPSKPRGRVYIIGSGPMGPEFYSLGLGSVPLEKGNYTPEVLERYGKAVEELKSDTPSGRLTVMDGPPGSGKTFLVRAVLDECPDAMFVFVLPNMVDTLASPALVPLLIRRKESRSTSGPIVFILEDGDNVLTPRKKDNLSLISTLLNMTSGILGSMLDLRVIATTNSPKADIDPALLRRGRLSQHMTIDYLPRPQAEAVYQRLLADPKVKLPTDKELIKLGGEQGDGDIQVAKGITLAMVYGAAYDAGWKPPISVPKSRYGDDEPMYDSREPQVVSSRVLGEGEILVHPGSNTTVLV